MTIVEDGKPEKVVEFRNEDAVDGPAEEVVEFRYEDVVDGLPENKAKDEVALTTTELVELLSELLVRVVVNNDCLEEHPHDSIL